VDASTRRMTLLQAQAFELKLSESRTPEPRFERESSGPQPERISWLPHSGNMVFCLRSCREETNLEAKVRKTWKENALLPEHPVEHALLVCDAHSGED
jgi:hypothetical protein